MGLTDIASGEHGVVAIASSLSRLDDGLLRPPTVVLAGEVNAGKSSVANALVGKAVLPTSIVENTRTCTLLRHAPALQLAMLSKQGRRPIDSSQIAIVLAGSYDLLEIALPSAPLKNYEILDTPGNMGVRWLAARAPAADSHIVAWCTVATQAWKESERRAWGELPPQFARDTILIVTHLDRLASASDREGLAQRLKSATKGDFRRIVFVDARHPSADEGALAVERRRASGIAELEAALLSTSLKMRRRRLRKAMRIVQRLHQLARRQRREDNRAEERGAAFSDEATRTS